ncbi:MAG: hypothetical protein LBS88_00835 [Tannerellaceae bacterium]|jgi:hypothetical protein|nr:hypothetical protein [Tannerellaceae bacterium]
MRRLYSFIVNHNRKFLFFLCAALYQTTISAQVHIGSEKPPSRSAMLEVSATDKGILFPSVSLQSIDDSSVIVNNKTVDGLLVFNTTEDASLNLYDGLCAWNSVKELWENIVSEQSFHDMLTSHYAIEETYLVANQVNNNDEKMKISAGNVVKLTFKRPGNISINKGNHFADTSNIFTVPKDGYYKVVCGIEILHNQVEKTDKADIRLIFLTGNGKKDSAYMEVTRSNINSQSIIMPLTPSLIYNGYLKKDVKLYLTGYSNKSGYINRKYLYINTF